MVRPLAAAGLVLLLVGVGGFFAYYPVFGKDTAHLRSTEATVDGKFVYQGYKLGDRVTIYGKVTKINYDTFTKFTFVQLDYVEFGWFKLGIWVSGDITSKYALSDNLQFRAFLDDTLVGTVQYWHVPTIDDVAPMLYTQAVFGGIAFLGLVAALAGMRSPRGAVPARPR